MIIERIRIDTKGLTFVELIITTAILSILVLTIGYTFLAGLRLWDEGYNRSDIRTDLSQAMEFLSKNLRQARSLVDLTAGSVTFTADLGDGEATYRVYLYNASDNEPNPPYTQDTYELRWAKTALTYGSGVVLAKDIMRPDAVSKPFSQTGNVITADFVTGRSNQSVALRTSIELRNL
ncbi:MAG TPA: hypothetical protein PKV41_01450 [Candidatus Omnitrophota bacterium]|nr:hypothetical protein [Candidatus Omnitrophota bacterium]